MAGETNDKGVIEFGRKELDPAAESDYRNRVQKARTGVDALKGNEPLGGVERPKNLPIFQEQRRSQYEDPLETMNQKGGTPQQGVQPRPGARGIRPETARQLEEAQRAAEQQPAAPAAEPEKAPEEDEADDVFTGFDFGAKDEADRVLNNRKRRKAIEARCKPMNFRDLLEKDEVRQIVPIRPNEFEPEYRSLTPGESLFIKQYMAKEENRTEMYLLEKYGLCQLACGLVALNDFRYVSHLNKDGDVDKEVFEKKLKQLMKKSGYVIADLGLNYHWFDIRVRKLINVDDVGNG